MWSQEIRTFIIIGHDAKLPWEGTLDKIVLMWRGFLSCLEFFLSHLHVPVIFFKVQLKWIFLLEASYYSFLHPNTYILYILNIWSYYIHKESEDSLKRGNFVHFCLCISLSKVPWTLFVPNKCIFPSPPIYLVGLNKYWLTDW